MQAAEDSRLCDIRLNTEERLYEAECRHEETLSTLEATRQMTHHDTQCRLDERLQLAHNLLTVTHTDRLLTCYSTTQPAYRDTH